jgi:hypothetical protein
MSYALHNPTIAAAMRQDPDVFLRGVLFAVCSIRQPIVNVPDQLSDVMAGDLSSLFGHKIDAYAYVSKHYHALRSDVLASRTNANRIAVLCRVPGLGIVKAAFVLQLMGYDVACLDSRNVKREGRNPDEFRSRRKTSVAFLRKIDRYLVEVEGRSAEYWDLWCADAAVVYKRAAEEISALHLAIVPDNHVPF